MMPPSTKELPIAITKTTPGAIVWGDVAEVSVVKSDNKDWDPTASRVSKDGVVVTTIESSQKALSLTVDVMESECVPLGTCD